MYIGFYTTKFFKNYDSHPLKKLNFIEQTNPNLLEYQIHCIAAKVVPFLSFREFVSSDSFLNLVNYSSRQQHH